MSDLKTLICTQCKQYINPIKSIEMRLDHPFYMWEKYNCVKCGANNYYPTGIGEG